MQTSSVSGDDCVSEQHPQSSPTQKAFLDWLESLATETRFCAGLRTQTCPVAMFLGRPAFPSDETLPKWALAFMTQYDKDESTSLADALAIARNLEHEPLPV
jgi:hypothetical protein